MEGKGGGVFLTFKFYSFCVLIYPTNAAIDFLKSEYSLCYTEEYSFYWNCNYVATYFYKSVNASVIKYVK